MIDASAVYSGDTVVHKMYHGNDLIYSDSSMDNTYIVFEDNEVRSICISNFDKNHDNRISFAEAAAVRDLNQVFRNSTAITSFNELQHFTGLSSIGIDFANCTNLTSIIIPEGVQVIYQYSFNYCSSLSSISIPSSVRSISNIAFLYCTNLAYITVDNGNTVYDSRNNCNAIIDTSTNKLLLGCKNTIIPNSVTVIGYDSFNGSGITSIVIPDNVVEIESGAFYECYSLTSVTIGNGVTTIGSYAFNWCSSLVDVSIGNSVTTLGQNAFSNCALTNIIIPSSVTTIGAAALRMSSLRVVTVLSKTPPSLSNGTTEASRAFTSNLEHIYVPASAVNTYKSASGWSNYASIIETIP